MPKKEEAVFPLSHTLCFFHPFGFDKSEGCTPSASRWIKSRACHSKVYQLESGLGLCEWEEMRVNNLRACPLQMYSKMGCPLCL